MFRGVIRRVMAKEVCARGANDATSYEILSVQNFDSCKGTDCGPIMTMLRSAFCCAMIVAFVILGQGRVCKLALVENCVSLFIRNSADAR